MRGVAEKRGSGGSGNGNSSDKKETEKEPGEKGEMKRKAP